jgi:hypothetical protein
MAGIRISARVTDNHLDDIARQLDWLGSTWCQRMAEAQVHHHHAEAPVGREFYTDELGHEHPGWLRDSADNLQLPDGGQWVMVHADYGIYVNNGTRYIAPNPFWDRALLRTEAIAEGELERAVAELWIRVRL